MKVKLCLCVVFLLFSCNSPKKGVLDCFLENREVKGHVLELSEGFLGAPNGILLLDTLLLLRNRKGDYFIDVVDLKRRRICKRMATKGKGPDVFLSVDNVVRYENSIDVFDCMHKRILSYAVDSILSDFYSPQQVWENESNDLLLQSARGRDSLSLSIGVMEKGMYAISSNGGGDFQHYLSYPNDEKHEHDGNRLKGIAYQGQILCHPRVSKFVYACYGGAVMEICSYGKNGILKEGNLHFHIPQYECASGGVTVISERESLNGFWGMVVTDSSIFVLYSGKKTGYYINHSLETQYVLQFSWKGEPLCKYTLDRNVGCIAVNSAGTKLYGIVSDPEPKIAVFLIGAIKD